MDRLHYINLSTLFDYPSDGYVERARAVCDVLRSRYGEAVEHLTSFVDIISQMQLLEIQELYTRSFDVQAITTLDVGYVLFGDDYKRGELLANLNGEHRKCDNDCGCELADHLPNLLRLVAKLHDEELVEELVDEIMAPALRKMTAEFEPQQVSKREEVYLKQHKTLINSFEGERALAYVKALRGLYSVLGEDFDLTSKKLPVQTSDFLKSIYSEMDLEEA
ncbi:MAG: hypothetical protein IT291_03845 [Deltaproteobacteria bacterium]|nr:hypothetical protein [Deltaproteobacteria bacterium]